MFQQCRQIVSKLNEQQRIIGFILSALKPLNKTSFLREPCPVTCRVIETVLYCSLNQTIKKASFPTLKINPNCLRTKYDPRNLTTHRFYPE